MNMTIDIPSYQRYEQVKTKTLALLERHNIPEDMVTIWVADKEEEAKYKESLEGHRYNNIKVGVPKIGAQRNFITDYYPEGRWCVMADDDIEDVKERVSEQELKSVDDLQATLRMMFEETSRRGAQTWGLYPVCNPFFMKNRINEKLCYIIACFTGLIIDHDPELKRTLEHAEDNEFSVRSFVKYGKLCRFENYTMKTKFFGKGGLEEYRAQEGTEWSVKKLAEMFPDYVKPYYKESSKTWEVKYKQHDPNQISLF